MHLEAREISAYLDRTLTAMERERVEAHLADCAECRREAIEVSRVRSTVGRRSRWLIGPPIAAAAAIAFLVLLRSGENPGTGPVFREGGAEPASTVVVVSPTDTDAIRPHTLTLTWRSAGAGVSYRVSVTDQTGDVAWSASTSDTTARLPATVRLRSTRYHWYVDALLPDGRSITSGVHSFQVRR